MLLLLANSVASNLHPFDFHITVVLDISRETNKVLSGVSNNHSFLEMLIPISKPCIVLIELGILPQTLFGTTSLE